jgi:hypothetical protein
MRHPLAFVTLCLLVAAGAHPAAADDISLFSVPDTVYKARDPGRVPAESWLFHVVVADARHREDLRPVRAELAVYGGADLRETIVIPESTLSRKRTTTYRITTGMDTLAYQRRYTLDEVFDLRFAFLARAIAWKADRVRVTLTLAVPGEDGASTVTETLDVPLRTYAQKTRLTFPLRGPCIVSQGMFNNAGHAGHSNQFAIDVLGLNDTYGPMVLGRTGNEEYAGWGREVLAPAPGRVVHARNDVPDNAGEGDPLATYRTLPDPMLAIPGNCVVIDHGNGEFSALMHLQMGSVAVRVGDTVTAGQVIGRLGNSGDANGPHLHYQLQRGPRLLVDPSLPAKFDDVASDLSRGSYFRPR